MSRRKLKQEKLARVRKTLGLTPSKKEQKERRAKMSRRKLKQEKLARARKTLGLTPSKKEQDELLRFPAKKPITLNEKQRKTQTKAIGRAIAIFGAIIGALLYKLWLFLLVA